MIRNLLDIAPIPDENITEIFGDAIATETVNGWNAIVGWALASVLAILVSVPVMVCLQKEMLTIKKD